MGGGDGEDRGQVSPEREPGDRQHDGFQSQKESALAVTLSDMGGRCGIVNGVVK